MVAQQLSSRPLNAFSEGASETKVGSLFHGPTTRYAVMLANGQVDIGAAEPCIDAREGGLQPTHQKSLPEAIPGYR